MLRVYPVIRKWLTRVTLALGYFVFVMGENVIDAAGMDVEMRSQVLHGHGAALDMPAGETTAPRAIPCHLASGFGCLPQRKIFRIMAVRNDAFAHACQHVLKLVAGKLA